MNRIKRRLLARAYSKGNRDGFNKSPYRSPILFREAYRFGYEWADAARWTMDATADHARIEQFKARWWPKEYA